MAGRLLREPIERRPTTRRATAGADDDECVVPATGRGAVLFVVGHPSRLIG
jgi:hypothetical protein